MPLGKEKIQLVFVGSGPSKERHLPLSMPAAEKSEIRKGLSQRRKDRLAQTAVVISRLLNPRTKLLVANAPTNLGSEAASFFINNPDIKEKADIDGPVLTHHLSSEVFNRMIQDKGSSDQWLVSMLTLAHQAVEASAAHEQAALLCVHSNGDFIAQVAAQTPLELGPPLFIGDSGVNQVSVEFSKDGPTFALR
ncbi:MAG TPA: hypothetical protein VD947_01545 [Patescibacteria group bacterium]|nr:hypothetical protein [Patescibacteria group bacterium]